MLRKNLHLLWRVVGLLSGRHDHQHRSLGVERAETGAQTLETRNRSRRHGQHRRIPRFFHCCPASSGHLMRSFGIIPLQNKTKQKMKDAQSCCFHGGKGEGKENERKCTTINDQRSTINNQRSSDQRSTINECFWRV